MLITCPECKIEVSDLARLCPHCGYPLASQSRQKNKSLHKRRRLPNGFGQITELKDKNLRNPFRVMVTTGRTETGKCICKLLRPNAYYPTYNEAYKALVEYNRNPYDLSKDVTVQELYNEWTKTYFKDVTKSYERTVTCAWRKCQPLYKMKARDIRVFHIKDLIESVDNPYSKDRMKSLFNKMFDYAIEHEIIDKNYARMFSLDKKVGRQIEENKKQHISFSEDEIKKLWDNVNVGYVDIVLIQCYMGWRPQELGLITLDNVHLDENYIIGGMKTDAGKDRVVPIIPKIKPLIIKRYNQAIEMNSEYLFNCTDDIRSKTDISRRKLTYDKYRHRFDKIKEMYQLNPEHRPHDPRKDFITRCKKCRVDEYAIKYIVGHQIYDITEKIYTDRNPEWLYTELLKTEDSF